MESWKREDSRQLGEERKPAEQPAASGSKTSVIEGILAKKGGKYADITCERWAYSRSRGKYMLILRTPKLMGMGKVLELEAYLLSQLKAFPGKLEIVLHQPWDKLEEDPVLFETTVRECVIAQEPALLPFIATARIHREGEFVDLDFNRELGPSLFERCKVSRKIEAYFAQSFGETLKIRHLTYSSFEEQPEGTGILKSLEKKREAIQSPQPVIEKAASAPSAPVKPVKQSKPTAPPANSGGGYSRKGKSFDPFDKVVKGTPIPMASVPMEQDVVIEGEVIFNESRLVSEGKNTILHFGISDTTTTILCKRFLRGDHLEKAEGVKAGKYYKVKGKLAYDDYTRDNLFQVSALMPTIKPVVQDLAEEKRVELHLHTSMSTQDGISSAKSYVKRAAQWGHKAIAITDHGVVQAFPEAASAGKECGVKIIYGMEAYMIDDGNRVYQGKRDYTFEDEIVVFDIETTGLNPKYNGITEIGAVRIREGKIVEQFGTFVNPGQSIPPNIVSLTGITNEMVADAPGEKEALEAFQAFAGNALLVAHNAAFDTSFVMNREGLTWENDVLDSLAVARAHLKHMKSHKLNKLAAYYNFSLDHHRAVNDAECTAKILIKMFEEIREEGITTMRGLNGLVDLATLVKGGRPFHTILLVKNKTGLVNLYKLVSMGHLEYFNRRPRIPKSIIEQYREGLIIGSACEQGEVYRSVLNNAPEEKQKQIASFYDYLEIQPHENNQFLIREGSVQNREQLSEINRRIIDLGKSLGKPTVATTDAHFLEPQDISYRRILMDSIGFKDADEGPLLYYRTTDEMLEEFSYLGEDLAKEVVIDNPNAIAESTEEIELFPGETAMPAVENADQELMETSYRKMRDLYGEELPEIIEKRLERELGSIIRHGFSVLYWIAMKLVEKSMSDGYLVGSRGSVGSSLAAYASGITEVNPLPPHYRCPNCKHSDFNIDTDVYGCGVDMPPAVCPVCGADYVADGYDIPFEVFLGIDADKVPDIDLNFSGEYQPQAHKYVEEIFGESHVFRAGTISSIKEKTAIGMVKKYLEKRNREVSNAEVLRLAKGLSGVKRTTGQHPGGLVIVPKDREVYEFTPIQKPADKVDGDTTTTHFDFNSMHDILIKLDILGHDNPTIIRMLQDLIGFDPLKIPLNDPETMSLFSSTKALGIQPEDIRGIEVGTLGIPEFGTKFVRQMLVDTRPTTMAELVRISGLSHGTDVWVGNAKDLIDTGVTTLSGAICTRDDIMNHLVKKGVEARTAFFIMESVRKGKWAKGKEKNQEAQMAAMREANVAEWFIESCSKIKYMFPKAHAVAYVVMALRIAYCKVHYPREYYATFFTVRANEFDATYVLGGSDGILEHMRALEQKGNAQTATEQGLMVILELALEMNRRGFGFLPVDLKRSKAKEFVVEGDNLRLPFVSIPKLGDKAAEMLEAAAAEGEFVSIEDLKRRAKLSQTVIDTMRQMGCLKGMAERAQLSFFDNL